MNTDHQDTIVVFTARSPERIVREGGSQAWVLHPARAKNCQWVLCTQNRHNPDHEFSDATMPHHTGFLLGKISDIRKADAENGDDRWMIAISAFARIDIPNAWGKGRNPVRYASLEELGINPKRLKFESMPEVELQAPAWPFESGRTNMSIQHAKVELAKTFGVAPEAIEITVRG